MPFRLCKGRARRFTLASLAFVGSGQSLPAGVSVSAASVRCVFPGPPTTNQPIASLAFGLTFDKAAFALIFQAFRR